VIENFFKQESEKNRLARVTKKRDLFFAAHEARIQ